MTTSGAPAPVITLTTDFGLADPFVGIMKGIILGISPNASIVDVTHEVQPFAIEQGAFLIATSFRYFPAQSIHVVVVDPGVGTARRPILVEAHGHWFVGPDNGVLARVYREPPATVREITAQEFFLPGLSRTFHGRDIFAPVAAHLAAGVPPTSFGDPIEDYLKPGTFGPQRTSKRHWSGTVQHVDRYGNLITDYLISDFEEVRTRPFEIILGPYRVQRLAGTFADGDPGELMVVAGSTGYLEVVANQASATKITGCGLGSPADLALY